VVDGRRKHGNLAWDGLDVEVELLSKFKLQNPLEVVKSVNDESTLKFVVQNKFIAKYLLHEQRPGGIAAPSLDFARTTFSTPTLVLVSQSTSSAQELLDYSS
jgi:hypothetical protein